MTADSKYLHSDTTHKILQGFFTVCRQLPFGLPVTAYKKALAIELANLGLLISADQDVILQYAQQTIGSLPLDLLVDNQIVLMIISEDTILPAHETAMKNRLRMSKYEVGLILNFGIEGQHKRLVYTNDLKK